MITPKTMLDYELLVAERLDQGASNTSIIRDLIQLQNDNKIVIPPRAFVSIDRYRLVLENAPNSATLDTEINTQTYPFFVDEPKPKSALRTILKSKDLKTLHQIENAAQHGTAIFTLPNKPQTNRITQWQWNRKMGNKLKLFDQSGKHWQERQFQRLYQFLQHHKESEPDFVLLRLYANNIIDLNGRLKPDIACDWRLFIPIDLYSARALADVRRTIELILGYRIDDILTSEQMNTIEKASNWIWDDLDSKWLWIPNTLAMAIQNQCLTERIAHRFGNLFGSENGIVNWQRIKQAFFFIRHNIDKPSDYSLLVDWLNKEVNIDGIGKARCEMEGTWEDTNISAYFS